MESKRFSAGQVVFKEGEKGSEMYFIVSGRVSVFKTINGEKIELAVLTKGDFMGEMTLFLNEPRSANAIAVEDTQVAVLNKELLLGEIQTNPQFAYGMIHILLKRIKGTQEIIGKLEGIKKSYEIMYGRNA